MDANSGVSFFPDPLELAHIENYVIISYTEGRFMAHPLWTCEQCRGQKLHMIWRKNERSRRNPWQQGKAARKYFASDDGQGA